MNPSLANKNMMPFYKPQVKYEGPWRVRMDPRRKQKRGESLHTGRAAEPLPTIVSPELIPTAFNFSKIDKENETLKELSLRGGSYAMLVNKFPLFERHMLLVSSQVRPQLLTQGDLTSVAQLTSSTGTLCHTCICSMSSFECSNLS